MPEGRYFGFYWTLPVGWAGFDRLPEDVDSAAERSRTIRYQRDMVRRWVKEQHGTLIGEQAFLELEPDRGTSHITPEIERVIRQCRLEGATIILVDFSAAFGWRPHGPLWRRLRKPDVDVQSLYPERTFLDGQAFDPVEHFRAWREIEAARIGSKETRKAELAKTISELRQEQGSLQAIAAVLNERGLTSITGKDWTADNLRKFIKEI